MLLVTLQELKIASAVTDLLTTLGVLLGAVAVVLAAVSAALIIAGIISFRYFESISRTTARIAAREEAQIIAAHAVNDFIAKALPAYSKMRDSMESNISDEDANRIAESQDPQ